MPYSSATGASGVAHLACAYGVPIISSDIPDFAHMAEEESMAIEFYRTGDSQALADKLVSLLGSRERQKAMAIQNFSAALRMTMPSVIHEYVRHFGVAQQTRALRPIRWFRRLPLWISRSFLGKAMLRGLMRSNYRLRSFQTRPGALNGARLFDANGHSSGRHLGSVRSSSDSNSVIGDSLSTTSRPSASTRTEKHGGAGHRQNHETLENTLPFYLPNANDPKHSECEQARIDESLLRLPPAERGRSGSGGNGKSGSHVPGVSRDNGRGKGTGHSDGEI